MENKRILQNVKIAGKSLAMFAIISAALVAITFSLTESRIAENEKQALLKNLHELIPPQVHDNDLYADKLVINAKKLNYRGKPITVYRARMHNQPVSAIFSIIAPDGYNGAINLLIAIRYADETISGVRVISHKETPGLGDAIETQKSDWIHIFDNTSLTKPSVDKWSVKKDGGAFDQLTGATITPRAIVKVTKKTLRYFSEHKVNLFESRTENGNNRP